VLPVTGNWRNAAKQTRANYENEILFQNNPQFLRRSKWTAKPTRKLGKATSLNGVMPVRAFAITPNPNSNRF
jgi:hypothetical protein